MSADDTIRILLMRAREAEGELNAREWKRVAARVAWVRETMASLRAAQHKVDEAWARIFDGLPDDLTDEELEAMSIPEPPEQAELDALYVQIRAVVDHDLWPKELYWSAV